MTAPYSEVIIDPPAAIDKRVDLPLHENGIFISNAGIDWGDAQITAFEADMIMGSSVVDYRIPNRNVVINLAVFTDEFGNVFSVIKRAIMQKVGLLQREGGVIQRLPGLYADIVSATLAFPDVYGEAGEIETNVVLTLECLPDFYGDEITLDTAPGLGKLSELLTGGGLRNLVPNPSFEYDTVGGVPSGWTPLGPIFGGTTQAATLSVVSGHAFSGGHALEVIAVNTQNQGAVITVPGMFKAGVAYSVSAYLQGSSGGEAVELGAAVYASGLISDDQHVSLTLTTTLTRHSLVYTPTVTHSSLLLYLKIPTAGTTAIGIYMDAVQVTSGAEQPYFDGDSSGYAWLAAPGRSASGVPTTIDGDYPARCRIVITDTSDNNRDALLWAVRSRYYDLAGTAALVLPAQNLTLLNGATVSVTYYSDDQSSTGVLFFFPSAAIQWAPFAATDLQSGAPLTHVGSYRVIVRMSVQNSASSPAVVGLRLVWGPGNASAPVTNPPAILPPVAPNDLTDFLLVDLGMVRVESQPVGATNWFGVLQATIPEASLGLVLDELLLIPVDESAGQLGRTTGVQSPLVLSASATPTTAVDSTGIGTVAWTNPSYITVVGESASISFPTSGTSHYLEATGFGFALPSTAVIAGIQVTVAHSLTSGIHDQAIQLIKGGTLQITNRSDYWDWSYGEDTYGGSADLWESTWAASDINAATFGVAFACTSSGNISGTVSSVTIEVFYTLASGPAASGDAVLYANQSTQLCTSGMVRTTDGSAYAPVSVVSGDLPRLPPSGLEGRPVELMVKPSRGDLTTGADAGLDGFTAQVIYRPCWLFPSGT